MRGSARKHTRNTGVKSSLKTLEKRYLETVKAGKKEDAEAAFRAISSRLDKAAKTGVIHKGTADRKKSRLALRLRAGAAVPHA